jgi:hypothetical protein
LRGTREKNRQAVAEAKAERLADRWHEPLLRLCADPEFCRILQAEIRKQMSVARARAVHFGLRTIRGLAMCFDILNGDGFYGDKIEFIKSRVAGITDERDKLRRMAEAAAEKVQVVCRTNGARAGCSSQTELVFTAVKTKISTPFFQHWISLGCLLVANWKRIWSWTG